MRHRVLVSVSAVASLAAFLSQAVAPAAAQTAVPRTVWGHPDLQGTWDFRSITSLERPEELGDREFLSEEEAAELEQARTDRNARLLTRPAEQTPAGGDVCFRPDGSLGAYNNLWLDLGTTVVGTRAHLVDHRPAKRTAPGSHGRRPATGRGVTAVCAGGGTRPNRGWTSTPRIVAYSGSTPARRSFRALTTKTCRCFRPRTTSCC